MPSLSCNFCSFTWTRSAIYSAIDIGEIMSIHYVNECVFIKECAATIEQDDWSQYEVMPGCYLLDRFKHMIVSPLKFQNMRCFYLHFANGFQYLFDDKGVLRLVVYIGKSSKHTDERDSYKARMREHIKLGRTDLSKISFMPMIYSTDADLIELIEAVAIVFKRQFFPHAWNIRQEIAQLMKLDRESFVIVAKTLFAAFYKLGRQLIGELVQVGGDGILERNRRLAYEQTFHRAEDALMSFRTNLLMDMPASIYYGGFLMSDAFWQDLSGNEEALKHYNAMIESMRQK